MIILCLRHFYKLQPGHPDVLAKIAEPLKTVSVTNIQRAWRNHKTRQNAKYFRKCKSSYSPTLFPVQPLLPLKCLASKLIKPTEQKGQVPSLIRLKT